MIIRFVREKRRREFFLFRRTSIVSVDATPSLTESASFITDRVGRDGGGKANGNVRPSAVCFQLSTLSLEPPDLRELEFLYA